uniref:Uncharacterized protein n=1 Tax=Panagrolaimus superbus TaxID=310955 RepID=A0A914Y6U2_9BILA
MVEKDTVKPRPSLKHIKKEIDQRFSSGSSIPHQSSPTSDDDNQREATPDATTDETPLKGTSYSLENITKGEAPKNSRNSKEIFEIALAAQRNLHAASARLFRTVHYDEQSRIRQNKLAEELLSSLKSKLVHEEAEAKAKAELATLRLQQEHSKVNKSATNTP